MVEELSAAAHQRKAVLAGDRAYRAAQDAFSDAMQAAETEHEAHGVIKLHIGAVGARQPGRRPATADSATDELEAEHAAAGRLGDARRARRTPSRARAWPCASAGAYMTRAQGGGGAALVPASAGERRRSTCEPLLSAAR